MESLLELVSCLGQEEVGLVENYFQLQFDRHKGKRLELFRLVRGKPEITDQQAAEQLYQAAPNSAYSHLKKRLRQNIIDLLFPRQLYRGGSPAEQVRFDALRTLQFARYLVSRSAFREAERCLTEGLDICQKHELEAERWLMQEILHADVHPGLNLSNDNLALSVPDLTVSSLEIELARLASVAEKAFQETGKVSAELSAEATGLLGRAAALSPEGHPRLKTQVTMLKAAFAFYHQNPTECLSLLQKIERGADELFPRLPQRELYRFQVLFGRVLIVVGKHRKVAALLGTWRKEVTTDAHREALNDLWFNLAMVTGRIEHARVVSDEMESCSTNEFASMKWEYYRAAVAFLEGDFDRSLWLLFNNKKLIRYKSRWLYGYKWLELLNFIETRKYDLVEYRLNAFRQLLKRHQNCAILREKYLCRKIGQLLKNNFDPTALQPEQDAPQWQPFGYEVFSFESWLRPQRRVSLG